MVDTLDSRVAAATVHANLPSALRLAPAADRISPHQGVSPEDTRHSLLSSSPRELARALKRALLSAPAAAPAGSPLAVSSSADGRGACAFDAAVLHQHPLDAGECLVPAELLAPLPQLEVISRDVLLSCRSLVGLVNEANPLTRFLAVVSWCLSSFLLQSTEGIPPPSAPGDKVEIQDEEFVVVLEQLSALPAKIAFRASSLNEKISVHGQLETQIRPTAGGIEVLTVASKTVDLSVLGETYLITEPDLSYSWSGPMYIPQGLEVSGAATIRCPQSGYVANLQFKPRTLLWKGARNKVTGKIKSDRTSDGKKGEETRFTISGNWDGQIVLEEKRTGLKTLLFESQSESPTRSSGRFYRHSLDMAAPDAAPGGW